MVEIKHYQSKDIVNQVVTKLNAEALVALPTETVYGLAADATSEAAVSKIFIAKQRPAINPLICHVHPKFDLSQYVYLDSHIEKIMDILWPGAITFVLRLQEDSNIAPSVTAGLDSVALRMPNHAFFQSVLEVFGRPIAAPSANKSKGLSPTRAEHVARSLADEEDLLIVDAGRCMVGLESTILDLRAKTPVLLRRGGFSLEALEDKLQTSIIDHSQEVTTKVIAPGQLLQHYAPNKPLRLNVDAPQEDEIWLSFGKSGYHHHLELNLSHNGDLEEAAQNLFDFLWQADQSDAPKIAAAPIPLEGIGLAINDRLWRAAQNKGKASAQ